MNEIEQAFCEPLERARATDVRTYPWPLDRISVRDYQTQIDIGAFDVERAVPQSVRFNVVVEVSNDHPAEDDNVDLILSYDTITQAIDSEIKYQRVNLLETLAERIAARVLKSPLAHRVFVRIEKLDRGPWALGVEIVRASGQAVSLEEKERAPSRVHVLLPQGPHPILKSNTILIAAPLENKEFDAMDPSQLALARAWLLELEQQAWYLHAQLPKTVVCSSRTELEWALDEGHCAIWAPQKMVLDQTDIANLYSQGFEALMNWFSQIWLIECVSNNSSFQFDCL